MWCLLSDVRTAIAPSTVTALWDTKDKLGIFNTERNTSTDRYGVSLWLWGDDVAKERIKAHFSLTESVEDQDRHQSLGPLRPVLRGPRVSVW